MRHVLRQNLEYFIAIKTPLVRSRLANWSTDQRTPASWIGHWNPWGYDEGVTVCLKGIISRLSISTISDFVDT